MSKTINLNSNYHTALEVVKKETGASLRFQVHVAIKAHFERYHPHLVPVLNGGDVDEALEPKPFQNKIGESYEN
jgi:hypothetical protein